MIKVNEQTTKDAYDYINERLSGFYGSTVYNNFWSRVENRDSAYYMQSNGSQPVWRSKLYFATFFMGCKALEAQLKSSLRQDPICSVMAEDGPGSDPASRELALLAHYDLNHDLYISNWRAVNDKIQWFATVFGCGVGREYFVSDAKEMNKRRVIYDQFGVAQEQVEAKISREEHTVTEAVHPLNFAHDVTKSDFFESSWASARFELPVSQIYKMLGDDRYYQPGVKKLIAELDQVKHPPTWTKSKDCYYSKNESSQAFKNTLICDEYSGDLNFKGNFRDQTLYYALIVRRYNIVLRIGQSPFARHPYWKERPYPDPTGPYGIGGCDALLPVGYLKNSMINQYVDYVNSSLKIMYEMYDGNIRGGAMSLITGLPHGIVLADTEEAYKMGALVRPVNKDRSGVPGFNELISYIDRYEQEVRPASAGRGRNDAVNETATAVGFMAQREDSTIASIQDCIDSGIEDCMQQKMRARIQYATQPVMGFIKDGEPPVQYYPMELAAQEYSFKVARIVPDVQAGKYMAYLKTAMQFQQSGIVDMNGIAKLLKVVGRAMNIDEIDEIIQETKPKIETGIPEAPTGQTVPGVTPIENAMPVQSQPAGAMNAVAA